MAGSCHSCDLWALVTDVADGEDNAFATRDCCRQPFRWAPTGQSSGLTSSIRRGSRYGSGLAGQPGGLTGQAG